MPLTPSFTLGNNLVNTSSFLLTDTSTGSDGAIANRLLYLYLDDNSLFTGAPIQFPLSAGTSETVSILTQDFAFAATLQWVNSGGTVLYQVQVQLGVFTGYLEWFYYGLVQLIASQSNIVNDRNYYDTMSDLRTFIDSANISITTGSSIFNSQNMILKGQYIVTNQNLFL